MISKKIILIGDFSTGKTSLIRRFVDNQFSDTYLSTIGVKISKKLIRLANGEVLQGLIWDIEGGTEQKPLNTTYLIGAHGCIIVADVTRQETISNIKSYIESVQKISVSAPFILVLNKCDCISTSQREEIFDKVLSMYNCTTREIYLASAKSGEGVETMFNAIAGQMLAKG